VIDLLGLVVIWLWRRGVIVIDGLREQGVS